MLLYGKIIKFIRNSVVYIDIYSENGYSLLVVFFLSL